MFSFRYAIRFDCSGCGVCQMKINTIKISNSGYVHCQSQFYSSSDILGGECIYEFSAGKNMLVGEIDSGVWAVSYLMSMFDSCPKDFILSEEPLITVNESVLSLHEFSEYTCYMDESFPLFSGRKTVKDMVEKGIQRSGLRCSPSDIRDLFGIFEDRFTRPLAGVGNEMFKAMAAIGYAYHKQVFCFPWLSRQRFDYYHENLTWVLDKLESLGRTAIVPVGESK